MSKESGAMTLKISELKNVIRLCMEAKIPVFLHGAPGIGKSDAVKQIGQEQKRLVIDLRMSLLNPVDLRGVPVAKDGQTAWWAPSFLPRADGPTSTAILFLDEMNAAPPAVQAAAYQLVLDRRVGEYVLPDGVDVIAAGNRGTDRAIVYEMSSALRNRFAHYEVAVDLDEWKDWAFKNGVRNEIVSYLNYKGESRLFFFDPKVHVRGFPTPRSWAFASRQLDQMSSIKNAGPVFAGVLGETVATELMGFLKYFGSIPSAEDVVVKGQMDIKAPKEAGQLYAFCGALVSVATRTKDDDEKAMKYGQNLSAYCAKALPTEFSVLTAKDYARTEVFARIYQRLIMTKAFKEFTARNGEMIVH